MNVKHRIAVLLLILALSTASYLLYHRYYLNQSSHIEASGTIEATVINMNAKINGTIKNLPVNEGEQVVENQLVAELVRNDLEAQKERDALSVLAAQARLDDLVSGARSDEIKEAVARVNIARSTYEQSSRDLERLESIFQAHAIAEEKVEQARLNNELKENELTAAEAKLNLLESGSRPGVISAATAELERSKAVLKASEAVLEDLKIIAPLNGTVISKNYETGEYAAMGSSLLSIADLQSLWIKVFIPTDELPHIKLGQMVEIKVSGSDHVFSGTVREIATRGEYTPKTIQTKRERANVVFAVKIDIANPDGVLKPGMPADVTFSRS